MMMPHASATESLADLCRFRRAARLGWCARICERAARGTRQTLGRRRVENGNGRGEGETRARRGREARRPGAAYPYLTQRALGREQVNGVEHAPTRARARERRPRRRV